MSAATMSAMAYTSSRDFTKFKTCIPIQSFRFQPSTSLSLKSAGPLKHSFSVKQKNNLPILLALSGDGDNGNNSGDGDNGNNSGDGDNGNNSGDGDNGNNSGDGDNGNNSGDGDNGNNSGGGDRSGGGGGGEGDGNGNRNEKEAFMVLLEAGRSLDSLPKDLAAAIGSGRIPGSILKRYLELEKSPFLKWLLQFGGFKERLLADDLFLAKVGIECGVGMLTKTAAEYEKRKENFFKELEIVFADVVMAVIADFMLVFLPAPTVSLRSPISLNAGRIATFFYNCPDNAFQTAIGGASYSLLQRLGAIARNGTKLFGVGTASSLVGTVVTNTLINAKKAVQNSSDYELENIPVLSTSVGYGVYMAISSNLRYQILAGVVEQRFLEPLLHQHKLMLSAACFIVRTGNTYLGSLLWVDKARLVGLQKVPDVESSKFLIPDIVSY